MVNDTGKLSNILTNYSTMPLEDLTKYQRNYVGKTISRDQDDRALFECLMNSILAGTKKKIMVWSTQFKYCNYGP